ncbi:MAG TPA: hypothetical protein VIF57_05780 [Polyangia bacterium]|jgi:hypothetical protein
MSDSSWTWQAGFLTAAGDNAEGTVTAATVDSSDSLILAGAANGPLQVSSQRALAESTGEQAFLVKVRRSGEVEWVRTLGLWPRSRRLHGHGITAMTSAAGEVVVIGDFETDGAGTPASEDRATHLQIGTIGRGGALEEIRPVSLGGDVLALAPLSKKEFIAIGCRREWVGSPSRGASPRLEERGGFVARLSAAGGVLWSSPIRREGSALPALGPAIGPPLECPTGLTITRDRRIFLIGHFEGRFRIGADALDSDRGTFLAEYDLAGQPRWARTVARRLVTTSFEEHPTLALLGPRLVTTGIVPNRTRADGLPGIAAFDLDGSLVWSRSIQAARGCCSSEFLVSTAGMKDIVVAGRGDSVPVLVDGLPAARRAAGPTSPQPRSAAFLLRFAANGRPGAAKQLPGFSSVPEAIVVGKNGSWVVGSQIAVGRGRGLFAHWIAAR